MIQNPKPNLPAKRTPVVRCVVADVLAGAVAFAMIVAAAFACSGCFAERAWAESAPAGVPQSVSGSCYIGSTWMVGDQSFFTVPSFYGQLEGAVPSSSFVCLNHTAAAPSNVEATYSGDLVDFSLEDGWVEYYVTITPPGATDGVTRNESGLVGYQRVGGTVRIRWDFCGAISLAKHSGNEAITRDNRCYTLSGAVYGIYQSQSKATTHRADQAIGTYTTGTDGTWKSRMDLPVGTYYVAETRAPTGYALDYAVYAVEVKAGATTSVNASGGGVFDEPQSNPVDLWATKADAETASGTAQGAAQLEGTLFEVAYYDGYYSEGALPASPARRWTVKTGADGKARASDELKVSGDEFYRTSNGKVTIPLGTIAVREVTPPQGYLLGDGSGKQPAWHVVQIKASDTQSVISVYTAARAADRVVRGGLAVGKVDRQNGGYLPQGASTLEGATFAIVNANEQGVIVDGTLHAPGTVVKTVSTELSEDGRYIARTPADCLPYGTYLIYETESPDGYLLDGESRAWSAEATISEDGQVVDLTDSADALGNQVIRGDFSFSKVDGQTAGRLGNVAFIVRSQTTGEAHVIVTDENGMVSTAADWNAHTSNPNANDSAVAEFDDHYEVDESLFDPSAGVWFDGRTDAPCEPDDGLGALPFDTYTVEEIRSPANEGYDLAAFTVRISRNARELDLGTVDDNAGPLIATSLADDNGVKLAPADGIAAITDAVNYENLDVNEEYTLTGTLHRVTEEGGDGGVVADASTTFAPRASSGSADVEFSFDTSGLAGARLVAFESLSNSKGEVVASHEDLEYEGQTVRVPQIGTELVDASDGDHECDAEGDVTLTDTVSYAGLTPGATYTVTGTLHLRNADGADAGAALDKSGRPITASQSFTAAESKGTVNVTFSFSAPELAGATVVAFEELSRRNGVYATHADISDEGQTVRFAEKPVQPATPESPKTLLAKTGDPIPLRTLALMPIGAAGLGCAALVVKRMQRFGELPINLR